MAPNLSDAFNRGTDAVFAADTITQLADAVDFEALERGDPEAMDFEEMGELVGGLAGRLVVKQTVGRYTPGQFAEQTVGYALGGAIGREGGRLVLQLVEDHRGDPVEVEIEVLDESEVEEREEIRDLSDEDVDGPDDLDDLDGGFDEGVDDSDEPEESGQ